MKDVKALQEKPSALKREHPALEEMKFINSFAIFLGFYPPGSRSNPDPDTDKINPSNAAFLLTSLRDMLIPICCVGHYVEGSVDTSAQVACHLLKFCSVCLKKRSYKVHTSDREAALSVVIANICKQNVKTTKICKMSRYSH
jgi:hypothetical protein